MTEETKTEKYWYRGGHDGVDVVVDGVLYTVERDHQIEVPAGALDDHPDFTKSKPADKSDKK